MADYEEQGKGILGLSPKGSLRCDNQMASNMTRNERDIWDDTSTTSAYFFHVFYPYLLCNSCNLFVLLPAFKGIPLRCHISTGPLPKHSTNREGPLCDKGPEIAAEAAQLSLQTRNRQ